MQWARVTLCVFAVAAVSVIADISPDQAEALLAGNWVNLGPVDGAVSIGSVPAVYSTQYPMDMVATESAKIFVELSKRMFPTGVFRMPPLDPYIKIKPEPVQVDHQYAKGSIKFSNVVVRGAKDFDLVDLRLRLNYPEHGSYRVDYNITIPKLGFKSNFETEIIILGPKQVPVTLDGSIQVVFDNLYAEGAVGASKVPSRGYVPDQVQLVGLLGRGGAANVNVKLQLENYAPDLLDSKATTLKLLYQLTKQDLATAVGRELINLGNKVLKGFSVQQLHAALVHDRL